MSKLIEFIVQFVVWVIRRPRLNIRITEDDPDEQIGGLKFEAENTTPTPSSLQPIIEARFLYPSRGRYVRGTATFDVCELDRELPPFRAKLFSASARQLPPNYCHAWFKVYSFRPTRGVSRVVRIRNAMLEPIGRFRLWFEMWRFKLRASKHGRRNDVL